ncbi:EAL domain-containing response regulator [Sulfurimonas autotrophica]|uniref:Response regulator receiver modulated diguanylate cyclase/phosphodiesterase n=1 Tax=Sulfurimonas autotrophica (strain ATCC BAA-671 / DSM 16294 / JCM 11897 / OK10) TaxID=563040 RepID=E0USF2_SULAO|nr:EAL domain-containing protein [Sulfurimonas autotrophica]ADN09115.1 response regulator receiver modulated diguanylate cyclase/phosphodiesterase [Sulfurimonas autotrophica DSM 16294]
MIDLKKLQEFTEDMKVLYVEDDKLIRVEIQEYLERFFPVVDLADNGEEGLQLYNKGNYDLVISDINMPKMNGIEMSKAILQKNPNQAIIINSAYNEAEYLLELFNAGIEYYVLKPVNIKQLAKILYKIAEANHNQKIAKMYKDLTAENIEETKGDVYIDSLTGLNNLSSFMNNITAHDSSKVEFNILIFLDIDNLQGINDLYGTDAGNKIIVDFANFLKSFANEFSYKIYHVTGDQFILLDQAAYIDTEKYEEEFKNLQEQIRLFSVYLAEADKKIDINATIGMSLGQDYSFEHADMALKSAKENHQSYAVYNTLLDTKEKMKQKIEWQYKIIKALENNRIVPVFQPIVDINGDIVKYEALMRLAELENGEEKLYSPDHFMEIAHQSKYYSAISCMMIYTVLDSFKTHEHTISINLSYTDIQNKTFMNSIYNRIKEEKIGNRIIVEILESENIQDYQILKDSILKFRKLGVKIAIDDFGSGYSNYKQILEINPEYIKIDESLVKNIDVDSHAFILTKSIASFFHELDATIIAEHVHNKEIYDILKKFEVDQFQGYYFYEPMRNI